MSNAVKKFGVALQKVRCHACSSDPPHVFTQRRKRRDQRAQSPLNPGRQ
jgi:hypothetical protein